MLQPYYTITFLIQEGHLLSDTDLDEWEEDMRQYVKSLNRVRERIEDAMKEEGIISIGAQVVRIEMEI